MEGALFIQPGMTFDPQLHCVGARRPYMGSPVYAGFSTTLEVAACVKQSSVFCVHSGGLSESPVCMCVHTLLNAVGCTLGINIHTC